MYKNTILAVDDDTPFCGFLRHSLEKEGFQVRVANTTEEARIFLRNESPDLMLLDVRIPGEGGLELCRWIRESSEKQDLPILMMSVLNSEDDKVRGLEVGADDYLGKPFHNSVLLARLRAVLRRAGKLLSTLTVGDVTMNIDTQKVMIQGTEVGFSPREFDILSVFAGHPVRLLDRHFICDKIWGTCEDNCCDRVDKYVKVLREKLGPCAHYIETVWGLGYRFVPKISPPSS